MKVQALLALVCLMAAGAHRHSGGHGGGYGGGGRPGSGRPGGGYYGGGASPAARACFKVLLPDSEKTALKGIVDTCIANNTLQSLLDSINWRGRHRKGSPAGALEANGYPNEALVLRTCIAKALGFVAADGTFNGGALKASIEAKVNGTTQQGNVQLGLSNCPTTGFANFQTREFLKCLMTYCTTGAPITSSSSL